MSGSSPRIAFFGPGRENNLPADMYGNKAAGLAAIASLGLSVPPGFALSVEICRDYYSGSRTMPEDLPALLNEGIRGLEESTGRVFGGNRHPLLLSVRSGSPVSMPGIMDTILNVGIVPDSLRGLLAASGSPRFVHDTHRRFLESLGTSVFGREPKEFSNRLEAACTRATVRDERELDYRSLRQLVREEAALFTAPHEVSCLASADHQLLCAAEAVIKSWDRPRAAAFRCLHAIPEDLGTAVTVQMMIFGNTGSASGAGVAFSRNPWNGEKEPLIDFRFNAQGEDVVSGHGAAVTQKEFMDILPGVYRELVQAASRLEEHYGDLQDIEFTVQDGRLYLLQARTGKRAPPAALQIAVAMAEEGIITKEEAVRRIGSLDPAALETQSVKSGHAPLAHGIPASGGVATGTIAFSAERAIADHARGPVILVRETASPNDITGIDASAGILAAAGARTSHAAVVARQMGKVCVVNCRNLLIEASRHRCTLAGTVLREGEIISLDGDSGGVYTGRVEVVRRKPDDLLALVAQWRRETG